MTIGQVFNGRAKQCSHQNQSAPACCELGLLEIFDLAKNMQIFPIDLIWLKVWSDRARHSGRHVFH
jgi:hypothetical protein